MTVHRNRGTSHNQTSKTERPATADANNPWLGLETLEPRLLMSTTVLSEGFEDAFPANGWKVNTSVSRKWDETTYKAHSGTSSAFSAEYRNDDTSSTYANRMKTYMQRTVNLSGYTTANLSFHAWFNTEPSDYLSVKVNNKEVLRLSGDQQEWTEYNVDLGYYAGDKSVTIKFEFNSNSSNIADGDAGFWIDDVLVTADNINVDADDEVTEATVLESVSSPNAINGSINSGKDVDMFAFDVTAGQQLTFDIDLLGGSGLDSVLRLFNSAGKQIAINNKGTAPGESASNESFLNYTFTKAGRYYVAVSSSGNQTYLATSGGKDLLGSTQGNYKLTVSDITPQDNAGNTLAAARNLGILSGTNSFSDFIGNYDRDDFYRFSVASTADFTLSLTGLGANANVQLIRDINNNGKVDSKDVLASSTKGGKANESISRTLDEGTYYIRVYRGSGDTTYDLSLTVDTGDNDGGDGGDDSVDDGGGGGGGGDDGGGGGGGGGGDDVVPPTEDWFSQTLKDAGLISLTRQLAADGSLSRNDVIDVFRSAASDDGLVDVLELADLRNIVSSGVSLGMSDAVRNLANKVANAHVANASYQGAALGNLTAGSTTATVDKLLNKWFFGTDRPAAKSPDGGTTYSYRLAAGELFQNGISQSDVRQGYVGDCYFLATLAGVALETPSAIQDMFIDNGDGTYTVRFYNNGVADYVTVDRYLPTTGSGQFIFAGQGSLYSNASNELWVPLAEKAYAQLNASKYINQDGNNSYQGISGGWSGYVYSHILGVSQTSPRLLSDLNAFVASISAANTPITLASKSSGVASSVVSNHEYAITSYNASTQTFTLYNPWGYNHLTNVSWSFLQANFSYWTSVIAAA